MDDIGATVLIGHSELLSSVGAALGSRSNLTVVAVEFDVPDSKADVAAEVQVGACQPSWLRWETLVAGADEPLPRPVGASHTVTLTSGSTGRPKVVRRPAAQRWARWYQHSVTDRPALQTSIVTAPLFNSGQFGVFSRAWVQKAHQVILPTFEPEAFLEAVQEFKVDHAYLVPAMFVRLLKLPQEIRENFDISSLNHVIHTGGPCAAHVKSQMIQWWGPIFWEAYGCSETSLIAECSTAEWLLRKGTVGKPIVPVAILDEAGESLLPGQTGCIHVDMANLPTVTIDGRTVPCIFRGDSQWFPTGDSGYLDDDGYLYVVGRIDELINSGGIKLYPIEIENALLKHPAVIDCVAFSLPDRELGNCVGVAIQIRENDPPDGHQLRIFLSSQLPASKVPTELWIQTGPLRAATGKLNRMGLRARLHAGRRSVAGD